MATWNNPLDVTTGDNLTATLWNNLLGANGSLKYLYDNLGTTRNIVLWNSTNKSATATTDVDLSFDTIVTTYATMQQNFPVTVPITDIPIPAEGMYNATFLHSYSNGTATTYGNITLVVSDGTNTLYYTSSHRDVSSGFGLYCSTFTFYAMPSSTVTVRVYYPVNRIIVSTPITNSSGASFLLTIAKVN